jgi:hypothetical protein
VLPIECSAAKSRPVSTTIKLPSRTTTRSSSPSIDKRHQHIKSAPAEVDRLTVGEELTAMRHNPEAAELDDRRRFGRKIHSRGLNSRLQR